jgi:transcription elongation factor GreA
MTVSVRFVQLAFFIFESERRKVRIMQDTILTQEGYDKLVAELEDLRTAGRDDIAERIAVARSFGDLSENAEYNESMNEQAKMEARISKLEQDLVSVSIIDDTKFGTETVHAGSKVKIRDVEQKKDKEYLILGKNEADPDAGIISDESPIGQALLGRKKGETVKVEIPNGKILTFKILKITK